MIVASGLIFGHLRALDLVEFPGVGPAADCDQMMKRIALLAAWTLAVIVVAFTLGPVSDRPQFGHPQGERFGAFFALGLCWAAAYPRRPWRVLAGLAVAAVLLEGAQALVPGRDPGVPDALAKIIGAAVAVALVAGARRLLRRS
jgi:VanZ family protein